MTLPVPDPPERKAPGGLLSEREMLVGWIELSRDSFQAKCAGLDGEGLALRSVPPSTLSLTGMLRHLAEVERHWFVGIFSGEEVEPMFYSEEDFDGDFDGATAANAPEALAAWVAACEVSRTVVAGAASLDASCLHPSRGELSLRWILLHLVREYGRHCGHADLLRQAVDGSVGG
jgi:hypothetical protein